MGLHDRTSPNALEHVPKEKNRRLMLSHSCDRFSRAEKKYWAMGDCDDDHNVP